MMTEQQDMLDVEGNVAGASHQGDNVKHLAIFFSIFLLHKQQTIQR